MVNRSGHPPGARGEGARAAGAKADLLFESLGPALKAIRRQQGLQQKEVAERAGVTRAMLSAYERSHRRPSLGTLARLLAALEVTLADLGRMAAKVAEDSRSREETRGAGR